jgi:predicted transcriptional regulator
VRLAARNRKRPRLIATREPQSVSEPAVMAHRASQNVQRILHRLGDAGVVRLGRREVRAIRPIMTARKARLEIDLAVRPIPANQAGAMPDRVPP